MAKITTSGGKLTVAELDLQNKATKAVDGAESKISRFTRLFDRTTRKNDIPSESTIKKAEEFVSKRVGKGKKNNELPGVFSTLFMLPFLLGRGSKTNEVDPETELRQVYGGDDELMKEKLDEEKKQRDEGKEVIDKQVDEDNKVSTEKKVDVDKIKEPEQDQKETDDKKSEVEAKKDNLDAKELEEGEKTEDKEKREEEEEKKEKKKKKPKAMGIDRLTELIERFTKLVESGTPMAGVGKKSSKKLFGVDVSRGGIVGVLSRGLVNAFTPPAAAADMSQTFSLGGVKTVSLTDSTTNNETETFTEVQPQENIMGQAVEKPLEYDQNLPIEERKKIIYDMAVKSGAKYPEAVVAQYQLETTSGENNIGTNNFFNLKAVEGMDSTEAVVDEYEKDGKKYQEKANFINFKNAQEAVDYLVKVWYKDYKGYTGVETNAESAEDVARNLEKEGFATDKDEVTGKPVYADKLIKILSENKPLVEKIKDGGSLLMSSMKNLMMKDEIEDIEDYSSTDIETDMGNTIVILKAPAKRNSMLPLSTPPPSASGGGDGFGGGRTNPNDSLTMLTVQALGGS
tara:strand:+ start:690 stop:2399 length:1710 start_codon:yes stop_codon:yes gene_type:complete